MAYGSGGYRGGGGGGDRRDQPKEYFKTKCSDCGNECEVPFKPTQGRPVYCRDCFKKHQPEGRSDNRRRF
jgi:CxxC-x17-CxxC domain-containing protein